MNLPYPTSPSAHYNANNSSSAYAENGNGAYGMTNGSDGGSTYSDEYASSGSTPHSYCPCRNHPTSTMAYMGLSQQLQSSLRQFNHPANTQCLIYRRIVELNDLLQHSNRGTEHTNGGNAATTNATTTYDSSTPSDNELLTPLSASSGSHAQYPNAGSSPGMPPQEWNNMAGGGYNPYFPMSSNDHHAVYSHVMT
ncbi:hypothetical protein NMY22_g1814 [Coprinellus aureogranulatus]|nr:hypothetical protein NMY22_g1814 [Coprinellus aureogranulatus]